MSTAAFGPNPVAISGVDGPITHTGINFAMLDNALVPFSGTIGQRFPLGYRESDLDGDTYRYVRFETAVVVGHAVCMTEAWLASSMTNANAAGLFGREIGVALQTIPSDVSTTNPYFGWIKVMGNCNVLATASATANAALCSSATTGQIGSTATTGFKNIPGIYLTQTGQTGPTLTTARIIGCNIGTTN